MKQFKFLKVRKDKQLADQLKGYPAIDYLNTGLKNLLGVKVRSKLLEEGIKDIYIAVCKADGFFYEDVANELKERGFIIDERMIRRELND